MSSRALTVVLLITFSLTVGIRAASAQPPKKPPTEMPAPQVLWPEGAPNAAGQEDADRPALWVFLPPADKAVGTGIVVCPGGGYGGLAISHEGRDIAEFLNQQGIAAFVLRYRLAPRYRHPNMMLDVQRAIRTVRSRAEPYRIAPDRIGVMGFSAGGHLASTAGTHFDGGKADATDPVERVSCRPDFMILCYPVVALDAEYTHQGSKRNLLGMDPDPALVELMSNEKQITPETPPTFLFHTNEDSGVPPENSVAFYLGLRQAKVPAELHIYERGRHGVGLAPTDPILSTWSGRLIDWLKGRGLLERTAAN